jgi:ATP-dependent Clp protease ATP-binding subunit ClpA
MLDFDNFSSRARRSINRATAESRWLGHNFVGSEQLLLGVLGTDEALAQLIGVSLESVRAEVERIIGRGSGYVAASPPLTPRAKQIVQAATAIADEHGSALVEPEHLLLAITDLVDAVGYKVLEKLGVSIPQLQQEILRWMQGLPQQPVPQPDEIEEEETITGSSLLPAVPPITKTAPTLLSIVPLPQENGRWVAQASAYGSGNSPIFKSVAYGDNDFEAIADALESLAQMYRNYRA